MKAQLDKALSQISSKAQQLTATMNDSCLGLPYQAAQFETRVASSGLYGIEILASFVSGWRVVCARLDDAHYRAAKMLLGLHGGVSLGDGGRVRQPGPPLNSF